MSETRGESTRAVSGSSKPCLSSALLLIALHDERLEFVSPTSTPAVPKAVRQLPFVISLIHERIIFENPPTGASIPNMTKRMRTGEEKEVNDPGCVRIVGEGLCKLIEDPQCG